VWDATTGEPLTPVLAPAEAAGWKALLTPDERPVEALLGLGRVLSAQRLDSSSGLVPLGPAELRGEWERLRAAYPEAFAP
jgi:hypothetical protein